jgi:hypothetical protein
MLSSEELRAWYERLNLSPETRSVIGQVRSSDPARRVGGGRGNVVGRYPSRKMGVTIQFESHRVELPAILEMEHNDDVLEYYDQPRPNIPASGSEARHRSAWRRVDSGRFLLSDRPLQYQHQNVSVDLSHGKKLLDNISDTDISVSDISDAYCQSHPR